MTDQDFTRWKTEHATLFRWGDADLGMIDLWREVFTARGYEAHELREASMNLAQTTPKIWRAEHLEYILSRVAGRRLARHQMERDEEDRRHAGSNCGTCGGSGIVLVPYPASVHDNEWVYPFTECGCACICFLGKRWVDNNVSTIALAQEKAKKNRDVLVPTKLPNLLEYELMNPDWYRQMQAKDAKRKAEREAIRATRQDDYRRGPLAKVIKELVATV